MKKLLVLALAACVLAALLCACGGGASSPAPSVSSVAGAAPSSQSAVPSAPVSGSVPAGDGLDLPALVGNLAEAAGLGVTIDMIELDLTAAGLNTANVVDFAGVQSQLVAQNGGMVLVVRAAPGSEGTVAAELEGYRDVAAGNEDYADFEEARAHIADARIQTYGEYVVYAVSATGDWAALDAALDAAFA